MKRTEPKPKIGIIGAGKLGLGLAINLSEQGFNVCIGSRDQQRTLQQLGPIVRESIKLKPNVTTLEEAFSVTDICLITSADADIADISKQYASVLQSDATIAHCSGSLSSDILSVEREQVRASCHPLNTFPDAVSAISLFASTAHDTPVFIEGDTIAKEKLANLWQALGCQVHEIESTAKSSYHAACVMACNYLTVLLDASASVAESGGLEQQTFLNALAPITKATLENAQLNGPKNSLSGPIQRGDIETIESNLNAIQNAPLAKLYAVLGEHALTMSPSLPANKRKQIQALLKRFQ